MDVESAAPDLEPEPVPAEEPAPKVPFYKKDLSFKRAPKEPKQKAERKPKPERKPKAERKPSRSAEPKQEANPETRDKVPFYKRDFSFKRSSKEWDAAEPAAASTEASPPVTSEALVLQALASG